MYFYILMHFSFIYNTEEKSLTKQNNILDDIDTDIDRDTDIDIDI